MFANFTPQVPVPDPERKAKDPAETPVMWLVGGVLVDRPFASRGVEAGRWQEYAAKLPPAKRKEFGMFEEMVRIYCRAHHGSKEPCPECQTVLANMAVRLHECAMGDDKPHCQSCANRCFGPSVAFQTRQIMIYSGPRYFLRHPVGVFAHLVQAWKNRRAARNGR